MREVFFVAPDVLFRHLVPFRLAFPLLQVRFPLANRDRISSIMTINESLGAADLAESPMCANGMKLLFYARDNDGITLTKSGGFFRKFVMWAAHEFRWPEHEPEKLFTVNKVLNEQDFFPLAVMHSLMLATRLIRHYKGKAVLTKAGRAMIGKYGRLLDTDQGNINNSIQAIARFPDRVLKIGTGRFRE